MLFWKKRKAEKVFVGHYRAMLRITKVSPLAHNPEFELLPAMFVVSDFAAVNAQKDRIAIADGMIRAMSNLDKGNTSDALLDKLNKRCDLYGEIIRGKPVRGDWFPGDISGLSDNPISKCTMLLGDLLYNPECAESYDTAPIFLYGIIGQVEFAEFVMKPLFEEMFSLFKDICEL